MKCFKLKINTVKMDFFFKPDVLHIIIHDKCVQRPFLTYLNNITWSDKKIKTLKHYVNLRKPGGICGHSSRGCSSLDSLF